MQSIADRGYRRFKVGFDSKKRFFICREDVIMKHPQSTLAKCLTTCKDDGWDKGDYIEIPHEGRHFKEILKYMAGDSGPLSKSLKESPGSVVNELKYHGLDADKFQAYGHTVKKSELCPTIDVFIQSIDHLRDAIELTAQPKILILNYVDNRKSEKAEIFLATVEKDMEVLMSQVNCDKCRVIGFEGDMLGLGDEEWTPSALVFGWREQPEYGLKLDKWYHCFAHRKCLVERRPMGERDLTELINGLES